VHDGLAVVNWDWAQGRKDEHGRFQLTPIYPSERKGSLDLLPVLQALEDRETGLSENSEVFPFLVEQVDSQPWGASSPGAHFCHTGIHYYAKEV
jgi:hypothetical protein